MVLIAATHTRAVIARAPMWMTTSAQWRSKPSGRLRTNILRRHSLPELGRARSPIRSRIFARHGTYVRGRCVSACRIRRESSVQLPGGFRDAGVIVRRRHGRTSPTRTVGLWRAGTHRCRHVVPRCHACAGACRCSRAQLKLAGGAQPCGGEPAATRKSFGAAGDRYRAAGTANLRPWGARRHHGECRAHRNRSTNTV